MGSSSTKAPLLPEPGKRNILITSVLSADCFARYSRARGLNTLYICGSDEYGTASETKALEEKTTPAELCSKYHEVHKRIYDDFSISFDIYGRTSTPQHTQIVQSIFTKLWENGFIEERSSIQPYCPTHKSFLADRFVEGECSLCGYKEARGDQCDGCGGLLDPFEQIPKVDEGAQDVKEAAHKAKEAGQEKNGTAHENQATEQKSGSKEGTGFLINPYCKLDRTTPEARSTKHLYLRLDTLQNEIEEWFESSKGQWSGTCVGITKAWLEKKLHPRSITRDLKWGVPIPKGLEGLSDEEFANKVFYVWFDACIGYPSITKIYTDGDDPSGTNWEKWWKNPKDVTLYQFMGKDNVPFHSIVFPACQLGTREDWTKVSRFSTTEYLNYERTKFSKSRNVGVFGTAVKDTGIDTDVWRFYLLHHRPEVRDTEFLWDAFVAENNDLSNTVGNLCNRILKFCVSLNKKESASPAKEQAKQSPNKNASEQTNEKPNETAAAEILEAGKAEVNTRLQEYLSQMEGLSLANGAEIILDIAKWANKFWHSNMIENPEGLSEEFRNTAVVEFALNFIHLLANLLHPFMPNTASSILTQLGWPKDEQTFSIPDVWAADTLKRNHRLGTPFPLFSRIPESRIQEWKEAFGGDEMRKQKAEEAAKAAAKKAAKQKKKEAKHAKKAAADSSVPSS